MIALAVWLSQSFFRKFRSHETVTPCAFAALHASRQRSGSAPPNAGVIPVQWNQSAPEKIVSQSNSPAAACEMAEPARS